MKDNFRFYVPAEIIKSEDGENKEMRIKGIASTGAFDQQGEELVPSGLDISYLVNKGFINWHHQLKTNPLAVIGVPDHKKTKITPNGLYVEAVLYNNNPMAKKAYEQTEIMASQDLGRKMGWSVEGKVLERDPLKKGRVLKAAITGIALTPMPINADTFAQICKAFGDDGTCGCSDEPIDKANDWVKMDKEELIEEHKRLVAVLESESHEDDKKEAVEQKKELEEYMEKCDDLNKGKENGGKTYSLDHQFTPEDNTINIKVTLDKAMTTASAAAVMPESLESKLHIQEFETVKKAATKSELFEVIAREYPDMSPTKMVEVANRVMQNREMKK